MSVLGSVQLYKSPHDCCACTSDFNRVFNVASDREKSGILSLCLTEFRATLDL